jgi:hypothetical protein
MKSNVKNILIIVSISVFLSLGILMIIIPCILAANWWPLLSIFVFLFSFGFPILTNSCAFGGSTDSADFLYDNTDSRDLAALVSWFATGIMITIGYAIPVELFRVSDMILVEMLLTIGGGTIILSSIILFQIFIISRHRAESDEYIY